MKNKRLNPRALVLAAGVFAVYLLHQDCWNWTSVEPLAFGFLPVGLWYHAAYSVLAAITMAVLVRFAWPTEFEEEGCAASTRRQEAEAAK